MRILVSLVLSLVSFSASAVCQRVIDGSRSTWLKVEQEFIESDVVSEAISQQEAELQVRCAEGRATITSVPFYNRAEYSSICEGASGRVRVTVRARMRYSLCRDNPTTYATYSFLGVSIRPLIP